MVGFVSAVVAELASGERVTSQLFTTEYVVGEKAFEPKPLAFLLFFFVVSVVTVGTLVPFLLGERKDKSAGPFKPTAELFNGRAAMMGFVLLVAIEKIKGSALF